MLAVPGIEQAPRAPQRRVAARPQLMRAMNEQLVLEQIRGAGPVTRTELAARTGLSKPTVGVALASLGRDGLVREVGVRTGVRGPAAVLHELAPDAGYVLGLDVGREYLRGALLDLSGAVRARAGRRVRATSAAGRVAALAALGDELAATARLRRKRVTQTVIGSPGVFDPARGALTAARTLPGWERPEVVEQLRGQFGPATRFENDVDLAAVAEREHGHGRGVDTFCFVSVGTGIGLGLILDDQLHRGAHGAAGEIAYLPFGESGADPAEIRRVGQLESAVSAAAVVRAARRAGLGSARTARQVFALAAAGDERASRVVAAQAAEVARAIASVVAVVDPALVVLGGGIGRAPGFAAAVAAALDAAVPFLPELRVSALGDDAVVDGALAIGMERAWEQLLRRG